MIFTHAELNRLDQFIKMIADASFPVKGGEAVHLVNCLKNLVDIRDKINKSLNEPVLKPEEKEALQGAVKKKAK